MTLMDQIHLLESESLNKVQTISAIISVIFEAEDCRIQVESI